MKDEYSIVNILLFYDIPMIFLLYSKDIPVIIDHLLLNSEPSRRRQGVLAVIANQSLARIPFTA